MGFFQRFICPLTLSGCRFDRKRINVPTQELAGEMNAQ